MFPACNYILFKCANISFIYHIRDKDKHINVDNVLFSAYRTNAHYTILRDILRPHKLAYVMHQRLQVFQSAFL